MARQQQLPGVAGKRIEELESKALELRSVRTKRQALAKEEETLQSDLRDLLKKHGFRKNKPYQFEEDEDGKTIKLDVVIEQVEERAYVRKHKDKDEAGEGEEAEEATDA
jgi:hypothetical protein